MSMVVPNLRKQNDKLTRQLRSAEERITLLAMQLQESEANLARCTLTKDVTSRIFMGFLMEAGTISELRKWFADFVKDMQDFNGDEKSAIALLESHGVSLRVPNTAELESGRWQEG